MKPWTNELIISMLFDSGLTVDGDVYGLHICVNIVNSCAFVRPRSLSGDRWDFQVLIIWCQVPCERSHKAAERGEGHSELMWRVNSCGLAWLFSRYVSLHGLPLTPVNGGRRSSRGYFPAIVIPLWFAMQSANSWSRTLKRQISFILRKGETRKQKSKSGRRRQIRVKLVATLSCVTGTFHKAARASKLTPVSITTCAQFPPSPHASVFFLSATRSDWLLSLLTFFRGCYNTQWLALCSASTHYHLSVRTFIFCSFFCVCVFVSLKPASKLLLIYENMSGRRGGGRDASLASFFLYQFDTVDRNT